MFNRKFKLVGYAVGLVAVSVLVLALSGVMQQSGITRQNILDAIQTAMGPTLVATAGQQLALKSATFFSNDIGSTWAYVPARFWENLEFYREAFEALRAGKEVHVLLGGFYIAEETPKGLKPGFYLVETINKDEAALVQGDEVVAKLPISLRRISLEELQRIMDVGRFLVNFDPESGDLPVIVTATMPCRLPTTEGCVNPPPPPPPKPRLPWKNAIPGTICFGIPIIPGFVEWELGCIDP